jgi:CubicO group peptidase (beta-lactamase class C family)
MFGASRARTTFGSGIAAGLLAAGLPPIAVSAAEPPRPTGAVAARAPYYPGRHPAWERRAPQAAGFEAERLRQAVAFAQANESKAPRDLALNHPLTMAREPYDDPIGPFKERGPATGLVVRHGYLVAEWGEPARVDMTFSVTKSFLSTVVGLAVDRGLIRDVHDRVAEYVPLEHFSSPHNAKITWDHLLRQTSDWEGTLWGKPDWADRPEGDPAQWTTRPRREPGRRTSTTTSASTCWRWRRCRSGAGRCRPCCATR